MHSHVGVPEVTDGVVSSSSDSESPSVSTDECSRPISPSAVLVVDSSVL